MGTRSPVQTRRQRGPISDEQPLRGLNNSERNESVTSRSFEGSQTFANVVAKSNGKQGAESGSDGNVAILLKQLIESQKIMQGTLDSLKAEQVSCKDTMQTILDKVHKLENLHVDVDELRNTTTTLKRDVNATYNNPLEKRLRRNNLVFHGVAEEENEYGMYRERKLLTFWKIKCSIRLNVKQLIVHIE